MQEGGVGTGHHRAFDLRSERGGIWCPAGERRERSVSVLKAGPHNRSSGSFSLPSLSFCLSCVFSFLGQALQKCSQHLWLDSILSLTLLCPLPPSGSDCALRCGFPRDNLNAKTACRAGWLAQNPCVNGVSLGGAGPRLSPKQTLQQIPLK